MGTGLSLAAVARKTGFEHQEYLGAVFKAHVGVTLQKFRRDNPSEAAGRTEQPSSEADPDAR